MAANKTIYICLKRLDAYAIRTKTVLACPSTLNSLYNELFDSTLYNFSSCSTQLSMKFKLLIKTKNNKKKMICVAFSTLR